GIAGGAFAANQPTRPELAAEPPGCLGGFHAAVPSLVTSSDGHRVPQSSTLTAHKVAIGGLLQWLHRVGRDARRRRRTMSPCSPTSCRGGWRAAGAAGGG